MRACYYPGSNRQNQTKFSPYVSPYQEQLPSTKFQLKIREFFLQVPELTPTPIPKKRANAVTSRKVEKITSPKKRFTHKIKGTLYNLIEDCFSNRYLLDIAENTDVEILVKPVSHLEGGQTLYPVEVLVLPHEGPGLISCSTAVNLEGFCTTNASLKKGKYTVVPVLLNWAAEASHLADNGFFESLTELYEDESTFNSALVIILQAIFCSVDLDEDGFLNRQEFDLFAEYVLGEHAEEWSVKIDDRLSFSEFVEECKFVLETDPSRFLHMFQQMGIDGSLKQKNAQSFTLIINSTSSKLALRPLSIAAYSSLAEKYFKKIAVEKGSSKKVKNMNDLVLYTHKLPHRATMVIQNQAHCKVTVQLDCTKSTNCQSHRRSLNHSIQIKPRTSVIGHHLFPTTVSQPWSVVCTASLN
ncbi:uncharacterized protein LOC129232351 [Uloborus diversus]|uniref:uncharacterized protein LOC129232351 n=1 Tax=Uloborus diversus TaxID=327109 RepID=UPI00240A10B7|nr:uncharacterized protein LOC129232351 [Uloborus diversus]